MAVDGDSLRALLGALGSDVETAAHEYARVHRRLVALFARRGLPHAEELADETVDRVARHLCRGLALRSGEPYGYFAGVAGYVYRESLRASRRIVHAGHVEEWELDRPLIDHGDPRLDQLTASLARLCDRDRELIVDYYAPNPADRVSARGSLAAAHGLTPNALRIRVHRIVAQLRSMLDAAH